MSDLPNVDFSVLDIPDLGKLEQSRASTHAPRILLLYGSLRERSYSRFLTLEAERLLIPTQSVHVYRLEVVPGSDLIPSTVPT